MQRSEYIFGILANPLTLREIYLSPSVKLIHHQKLIQDSNINEMETKNLQTAFILNLGQQTSQTKNSRIY